MQVIINLPVPYKLGISFLNERHLCLEGKPSNLSDASPPAHFIYTVLLVHYKLDTVPLLSRAQGIAIDLHGVGRVPQHWQRRSGEEHNDPVINMSVCHCLT